MKKELLDKIKTYGYWRINFEPLVDSQKFKTLVGCREAVVNNSVSLRGWDYPHIPRRMDDDDGMAAGKNYYEGWTDWWNHIEFWRMYQSGQFLHYFAVHEDWLELEGWDGLLGRAQKKPAVKPLEVLNVVGGVTYQITEVFQFLSRLAAAGVYDEGVRVSITVYKTEGRRLWTGDSNRHLWGEYKAHVEDIEFKKEFTRDEILANPKGCALEAILYVLTLFNWDNPSTDVINRDQETLINQRF
jgi:hypothetical protein